MVKKRIIYLDVIKVMGILLVIFNHSHWYISSDDGIFFNILHLLFFTICKVAVPLFLMVTGALLLDREITYKNICFKRIFRILIPLILATLLSCLIYKVSFIEFIKILFVNEYYYYSPYWLWYLYLLIGLYIMTPFIQKMIKNFTKKDFIVFIVIFVFVISLINESSSIMDLLFNKSFIINQNLLGGLFSISVGYFVTGYYLNNLKISSKKFKFSIYLLILSLFIGVFLLWYGIRLGFSYDDILNYSYFVVAIPSICTFIIVKYLFSKTINCSFIEKIIVFFSNSEFGVYLFHVYLIEYIQRTNVFGIISCYNSFLSVLLLDLVVFFALTIFVYFIKKIPIIKRFL